MEVIKLSCIVPVYNVEQYLRKCVDSLLTQDYENYEIILVDDGSTDNSSQICDDYVRRFEIGDLKLENVHIRVIHQKNRGLSAARNTGIAMAKGEYVCFVDSDDYWEQNVLSRLMEQVEREDLDVLRFDYQNVNESYEVFEPNKSPRYVDTKAEVVNGATYLNTRMGYACYAVMYIMRKSIVPSFTVEIHFEDVDWLPRMMLKAKRVNSTTITVYNYLVRQGSITKTQGNKEKIRKNIEDQMAVIENYNDLIMRYSDCIWLANMRSRMVAGVLTTVARHFYAEKSDYLNRMCNMHVFPLSTKQQGKTYARRAKLINCLGPKRYCFLMRLYSCI